MVADITDIRGAMCLTSRPPRPLPHPCPRKLHHPGERCGCARRLDLLVPHGHSRTADRGSLHCARLQNLRWRLTSSVIQQRFPCSEKLRQSLPASLRVLAEDHKGDAASKIQRPLSPERKFRRSVMSGTKRVSSPDSTATFATPQRDQSPEVIDFDPPSTMKAPRAPRVTFNEELNSEVPVIAPREKGILKPISKQSMGDITGKKEMMARKNIRAMSENHRLIVKQCELCFGFLHSLRPLWPVAKVCPYSKLPLQLHYR